jgi:hypothetical protein
MSHINLDEALSRLRQHKPTCSWISTYGFVSTLIDGIQARNVFEVGVAYGYHASYLLNRHAGLRYFGVDPYKPYDPRDAFPRDVAGLFGLDPTRSLDQLYLCVSTELLAFNGRASLIREESSEASRIVADSYADLVYVDGDHRPEYVLKDLRAWFPKVRMGGVICGDDFNWPGVADVILNFFKPLYCRVIAYKDQEGNLVKWSVTKSPTLEI